MGFNYKIYTNRFAQEAIEKIEQLEEPENSSVPQLENSSVPGDSGQNGQISDQYSGSELENSSKSTPDIQQANRIITQGALDTSALFDKLFKNYNLDQLGAVAGPGEAKIIFDDIIVKTLIKIQDNLGI